MPTANNYVKAFPILNIIEYQERIWQYIEIDCYFFCPKFWVVLWKL